MYLANHYMDPYHSHYRNHSPYPYYPPHGWEIPSGHPQPMDSSYRPPTYGPWPYNAGMHHPHPSEFHCCCNRVYPPDYYSFRPPLPQELPPPHLYYHGPFPQHSNTCPSYFVPPHPYPVEKMLYGYDEIKSHCCGCPNHVCHGAEKSNVKIEEQRPDVKVENEYKNADSGSIIRHPNNHYPFIWVPSSNMKGKENGKCYELSPQLLKEWAPMSRKMIGDVKKQNQDSQLLNGWAPVSSNKAEDVIHREQENQKERQFHWPIVWMPAGYDESKQKAKEMMEEAPNNSKDAPQSPEIKIIPLSWFENGHHDQKPATRDGSGDHGDRSIIKSQPAVTEHRDGMALEGCPKTTPAVPQIVKNESKPARENYKTIPVVPENKIDEKKASTYRTIPVTKESDENKTDMSEKKAAKKASNADKVQENGKTKHSESSTAKHSKLPPVCLRVDPFPRKKSGNGSSRSPSPPTRNDGDKAKKDVKEAQGQNMEPKQSDTRHVTVSEIKGKSPNEMEKGMGFSNETVQAASVEHPREVEVPTSKDEQKVQAGSTTIVTPESAGAKSLQGGAVQEKGNTGAESFKGCDKSKNEGETVFESEAAKDDAKTCRANLSEPDAAVLIQSAYRGYDVRRWQPLDKLQKIRNVHEQMQGVKKQLQCLEDSCKKPTEKEQVAIGETIMNLLLKLDTIQGLHPSIREARKSVARELVCLQEKLDTLCKQQSGEFNHKNSDKEKSDRTENVIQIIAPTVTTEACDKEESAVELGNIEEPSSVDSMEPYNAVPSGIPMEVKQDADANKQKNEKEESCITTMEEANEQGKVAGQFELQVPSSVDMLSDAALPEHPTDNQEHKIEEPNAVSVDHMGEKSEVEGEGKEVILHDAASTGDSGVLKQCKASTQQTLHAEAESNTGLSYDSTEDIYASAAAKSVESGVTNEKDGLVKCQDHGTAAVASLELKHDVSPAEEDQQRDLSGTVVHLEDSSVSLQDEEEHDLIPADLSVMSNTKDQLEEARDISVQEQAVDTMQDSTKEQDGMPEDSIKEQDGMPEDSKNNMKLSASGNAEKTDEPALLEPVLKSDSAPEETVVGESDDAVQCAVSGKDKPREDQETESTIDKLTGGSPNDGDSLPGTSRKEPDIQKSHPNLAEEVDSTRDEIAFPELGSCELSCAHEDGITGHERSEMEVSSESQTEAQKEHADVAVSNTEECIETPKEAPVDVSTANSAEDVGVQVSVTEECTQMPENSAEDVGVQVSVTEKCTDMPEDAQVVALGANSAEDFGVQVSVADKYTEGAVGANLAEEEAGNLKEDIAVQTENKASEEALSAGASPLNDLKGSNEKKLAEENQQLKVLLQKLLASGNDQMGVITDLSEKVKALEHKLARKKRSKVRVHRPSRHVMAKVH